MGRTVHRSASGTALVPPEHRATGGKCPKTRPILPQKCPAPSLMQQQQQQQQPEGITESGSGGTVQLQLATEVPGNTKHAQHKKNKVKAKKVSVVKDIRKGKTKVKQRARPGVAAMREIKYLQGTTGLVIPKKPFQKLVREVATQLAEENKTEMMRFQSQALAALQEAAESYLTELFEDAHIATKHAKRITLHAQDMRVALRMRGERT